MLDYNELNDDEKRTLRNALEVERIYPCYLEDHNILLMESKELFDYIYMYDLKKIKEAIKFIEEIVQLRINNEGVNKSIIQKILEENEKVIKLSDNHYAYKEN